MIPWEARIRQSKLFFHQIPTSHLTSLFPQYKLSKEARKIIVSINEKT